MTGTVACSTSSASVEWKAVRAMIASTRRLMTRAVSATVSWPPRWISPGRRYCAWPPSSVMPASKLMRVRVDGCSKIIASVRPSRKGVSGPPPVERLERGGQVEQAEQLLARVVLVGEVVAAAQGGEAGQRGRVEVS